MGTMVNAASRERESAGPPTQVKRDMNVLMGNAVNECWGRWNRKERKHGEEISAFW